MDTNDVIDVPDTPDRVSIRYRNVGNASQVSVARELGGSDSTIEGMQNRMVSRNLVVSQNRQNGRLHNLQSRDTGTSGRIATGRDIVAPVSKNSASENGSLFRKVACEPLRPDRRLHASSEKMDDRKNVHLKYTSEPSDRLGHPICPHREQSTHHKVLHEPSSHSAEKDCRSAKFRMGPPLVIGSSLSSNRHPSRGINDSNKGKEKVNDHMPNCNGIGTAKYSISFNDGNSRQKDPVNVPASMPSSRANGRKRLVRNGCISAHNIAMTMQLDKTTGNSLRDETSTNTNSNAPAGASHVIAIDGGINHGSSSQLKRKGVDFHPCSSREHGAKSQDFSTGVNVSKRQKKLVTPSHQGNSGNAACIGSRGESSSLSKTRDGSRVISAVIEVESSPEVRQVYRESPRELEARARQLEVDEMLARELQEQLYDEMPYAGMSEQIDSELAWRLQQEETVAHAPLNRNRVNPSGRSSQVRRQVRSQLLRNQPRRGRTRAGGSTSRLARLRNQIHNRTTGGLFPSHMDLDTRIELLEALEAVVDDDIRSVTQLLDSDREFTETDYELLLRLDENNHEHLGASSRQIINLPESTVQAENYEACSICLETPAVGDTIRHLPCLHKFHKDCIDQWLRRKRSCPVCKFDIA